MARCPVEMQSLKLYWLPLVLIVANLRENCASDNFALQPGFSEEVCAYDLTLEVVNVQKETVFARGLNPGEYALALLTFKLCPNVIAKYTASIELQDRDKVIFCCPFIYHMSNEIIWNEGPLEDILVDDPTNNKIIFQLGEMACDKCHRNWIYLGVYLRIKHAAFEQNEVVELTGTVGRVSTKATINIAANATDESYNLNLNQLSFESLSPQTVDVDIGEKFSLQNKFCIERNAYIDDLMFQIHYTRGHEQDKDLLMLEANYTGSENIPALWFVDSPLVFKSIEPNTLNATVECIVGDVLNTGCDIKMNKPQSVSSINCITLSSFFRLTDSLSNSVGTIHRVGISAFSRKTHISTIWTSIKVQISSQPLLDVNFHMFSETTNDRGSQIVTMKAGLSEKSNRECYDAAMWILLKEPLELNKSFYNSNVAGFRLNKLNLGNGYRLFEQESIRFGAIVSTMLSINGTNKITSNESGDVKIAGILRCRTYERDNKGKVLFNSSPIYFTASLDLSGGEKVEDSKELEPRPAIPRRSYLDGQDFIIFCDEILTTRDKGDHISACFRANDRAPAVWKYLGRKVSRALVFLQKQNAIVGYSDNEKKYLISYDYGVSWYYIDNTFLSASIYADNPVYAVSLEDTSRLREWAFTNTRISYGNLEVFSLEYFATLLN